MKTPAPLLIALCVAFSALATPAARASGGSPEMSKEVPPTTPIPAPSATPSPSPSATPAPTPAPAGTPNTLGNG